MADVLDNERGPAPLWVVPLAMVVVVALVVGLAWRWSSSPDPAGQRGPVAETPSPAPEPRVSVARAGNACGGDVEQPVIDGGALSTRTGLRILVGDRDLRVVDVDAGSTRVIRSSVGTSVTQLAQDGRQVVAVQRNPCSVAGYGHGEVGIVDTVTGMVTSRGRGDDILPGSPLTVGLFEQDGVRLRELNSTQSTPLPPGWRPYARTSTGYFASVVRNGFDSGVPPAIGVGTPAKAELTKTFGGGDVVGASADKLFWLAGDCPGVHCLLTWTSVDGTNTAQAIDTYAWGGSVSPDGTKMAFRKQRASGRLGEHPGPPNDIAILDMSRGGAPLLVLPGLALPAKAGLTLAWSPDSEWLVIGADLGTGAAVLVWRHGMDRPARVPVPPTGGGTTGPPALLVLPR
jgi:hypothetical protein